MHKNNDNYIEQLLESPENKLTREEATNTVEALDSLAHIVVDHYFDLKKKGKLPNHKEISPA